ncbi:MAG: CoB--CoM heterodisulfide reductase iron-sulfur subunit B family protein [Desulfobaccales bacterium]|jgi:heterodisulfide reductase subunit B
MKVSYYPGCSLEATGKPYNDSTQEVCRALGVELLEVPDWACCGSSPALKMNELLSAALSGVNLALLEKQEPADVVAPCPFCYRRLLSAQDDMARDPELKKQVQEAIEADLAGSLQIHNLVSFLRGKVGLAAITARLIKPLAGLKVVPFYGCYMVKPKQVTHCEDPEDPTALDEILAALGAEVLDWDFKTECCGAGLSLSKTEKVVELSGRLVREAAYRGADAIVVACQLCQANLDMRQGQIGKQDKKEYNLPIIYFTQLMGLALGLAPTALGLNHHLVDPIRLLEKKGLIG